jgi:GTP-binding protein
MKSIPFAQATFITSAIDKNGWPELRDLHGNILPEIAIVGRSNVGKSSLINHLLNRRKLAKVSSTPGKTQLLNFFTVDDALVIVDLPGYGYAKVSRESQATWADAIDVYLKHRKELDLILLLIDIRRTPTEEDLQFLEWATHYHKPILLVLTKTDKLNRSELAKQTKLIEEIIPFPHVHYSVKDPSARKNLIQQINKAIHGTH